MKRTVVIGDVHGCIDELEALLARCECSAADALVFVGDLCAKGPDSQAVIALAREKRARAVLGNHDAHVLRAREKNPKKAVKGEHLKVAQSLQEEDWAYLEAMPLWLDLPELGTRVVHAGVVPGVPMKDQQKDLLINLRSIGTDGEPSKRVDAGAPWASQWKGPEHIVFGHDALRGLQQHPFATGLDTGCVYGKELTALLLPERRLVSVKAKRVYKAIDG